MMEGSAPSAATPSSNRSIVTIWQLRDTRNTEGESKNSLVRRGGEADGGSLVEEMQSILAYKSYEACSA